MDDNKFTKEQENALKSDETSVTNEKMDSYEKEAAVLEFEDIDTNNSLELVYSHRTNNLSELKDYKVIDVK